MMLLCVNYWVFVKLLRMVLGARQWLCFTPAFLPIMLTNAGGSSPFIMLNG
jgi:hypothetical protein